MDVNNLFRDLLHAGLNYRYSTERWAKVRQFPGHPFPSLTQGFSINGQSAGIAELIQPPLQPIVLDPQQVRQLERITSTYGQLIAKIFETLKTIKRELGTNIPNELKGIISPLQWQQFDHETGYSSVLPFIRLDCVKNGKEFEVVDINSTRPAGVGDNIVLNHFFTEPSNRFMIDRWFVTTVSRCYRQWFARQSRWAARGILFLIADQYNDVANFEILARVINESYGEPIAVVSEHQTDTLAGDYDCIVRGRIKEGMAQYQALEELRASHCIISPLNRRFLGSKVWPYILAKNCLGFGDCISRDLVKLTAGRVGLLSGDMVDFGTNQTPLSNLDHQRWLAKPINGSSGKGIVFGVQHSQNKWLRKVKEIPGEVVLERYAPCQETLVVAGPDGQPMERQLYTKYGVFILNGKLSGVEVMARPSPLVHGARDTYIGTCVTQV